MATDFATVPVPEAHHGHGTPAEALQRTRVGVVFFILADLMLVLAFVLCQVYLKALNTDHAFLPARFHLPSALPGLGVVVVGALGALAMVGNLRNQELTRENLRSRALLALVLFVAAGVLQAYVLSTAGFGAGASAYVSSFYVLGWLAVVHLGAAAFGSLLVLGRASRGRLSTARARAGVEFASWWAVWAAVAGLLVWAVASFVA